MNSLNIIDTLSLDQIKKTDWIIIGSGFFGSVLAERIATQLNQTVLIIEKRSHIGGNCFSTIDSETGIEYHKYGPHIFHTSNQVVWNYVNQFTTFNNYRHKVYTTYQNRVYSMPINLGTINKFFNQEFSPKQAQGFLREEIEKYHIETPSNLEEKAISLIGKPLYEAFIKGYTQKQWQTDLTKLPASIINRLPVRFSYNNDYFDDPYQGIPTEGYTAVFEKMLSHPNISICLNTDYFEWRNHIPADKPQVYTGPLDLFFDYKHGVLGWRTVEFSRDVKPVGDFFGNAVMNFGDVSIPHTRAHEFRHYHSERQAYPQDKTLLFWETSRAAGIGDDPYYPINTAEDTQIFAKYQDESKHMSSIIFGGRLGNYKYWDMHHTIAAALSVFDQKVIPLSQRRPV